jgi:hypothetical protein
LLGGVLKHYRRQTLEIIIIRQLKPDCGLLIEVP